MAISRLRRKSPRDSQGWTFAMAALLLVAGLLLVLVALTVPPAVYPPISAPNLDSANLTDKERFDLQNARLELQAGLRQTLMQTLAVVATLSAGWLAWRQAHQQRQEKREDQYLALFTEAMEALSNESPAIRVGGIYSLDRLARLSTDYKRPSAEILTAFLQEKSPWPPKETRPPEDTPIRRPSGPNVETSSADVQTALTVLVQLKQKYREELGRLVLPNQDLRQVNLDNADLKNADLRGTHLTGSWMPGALLVEADLTGASIVSATLTGANLSGCTLTNADLTNADLRDSTLTGVDLTDATWTDAKWPSGFSPPEAKQPRILDSP